MSTAIASGASGRRPAWMLPVMVALIILAAGLLFRGLVQALPYHFRDLDEPNIWTDVQHLRTTGGLRNTYAPLRIIEGALEFAIWDVVTPGGEASQASQFVLGRTSTALFHLLLLPLAYQTGRQLHSPIAGLATMIFFLAQPDVVRLSKVFRVDSAATLLGMLCLLLTIRVSKGNLRLIVPAFAVAVAAVLTKYTMLLILFAPSLGLVFFVIRKPLTRVIILAAGLILFVAAVLLILNPPAFIQDFLASFQARQLYGRGQVFRFVTLSRAWPQMLDQINPINLWLVVAGLPFAIFVFPRVPLTRRQWTLVGILALMIVAHYLMVGLFETNRPRDRFLIVIGFSLLWGLTLALLSWPRPALAIVAGLVLIAPWVPRGWAYGTQIMKPDTRALLAEWFIDEVPQGARVASERIGYFDFFSGFPGPPIYHADVIDSVYASDLATYQAAGYEYLVAHEWNRSFGGYYSDPGRPEFLETYDVVNDIPVEGRNGPQIIAFKIPSYQQHVRYLWFGDGEISSEATTLPPIAFRGYDLPRTELDAGFVLEFTLHWMSVRPTNTDYIVETRLVDPERSTIVAQEESQPDRGARPTSAWLGDMQYIPDTHLFALPADLEPGTYDLQISLVELGMGDRLAIIDLNGDPVGDSFSLGEIVITG